jgi:hypothetical protein
MPNYYAFLGSALNPIEICESPKVIGRVIHRKSGHVNGCCGC